jgi:hypothetical protein
MRVNTFIFRSVALVLACGCASMLAVDPPWKYVLRIGDANAIAQWTLGQRCHEKYLNGAAALRFLAVSARDPKSASEAIDAYVYVVQWTESWPDDKVMPLCERPDKQTASKTEELTIFFSRAIDDARTLPENANARTLCVRLRPRGRNVRYLDIWHKLCAERHFAPDEFDDSDANKAGA